MEVKEFDYQKAFKDLCKNVEYLCDRAIWNELTLWALNNRIQGKDRDWRWFEAEIEKDRDPDLYKKIYIRSMTLTHRTTNCLVLAGIKTLEDLLRCSELDLIKIPNCGKKSVNEIKEFLSEHGLKLSANDKERPNDPPIP